MATNRETNIMPNSLHKEQFNFSYRKISTTNINELECDTCYSTHIIKTVQGYVCADCGLVVEGQNIAFNQVSFNDLERYARLGKTHLGTIQERMANGYSVKLSHMERMHSILSNEKELQITAKKEISRIISHLNLVNTLEDEIFKKFLNLRSALNPGTRYRIPERLVPLCIYVVCKLRNISINETDILEVSHISKKQFNAFKLQIQRFLPIYKERDRQSYVLQRIMDIVEHFKLGMNFYFQSKKLLMSLWNEIKNTKDDVVAGLVSSVVYLCEYAFKPKEEVNVHLICKRLEIKMSTVQAQVKRRIFERFKVDGFTTLLKSAEILKQVLKRKGLLDHTNTK